MADGSQYFGTVAVTTSGQQAAYGFPARNIRIDNDGTGPAYLDLTTTSGGSTGGFKLPASDYIQLRAAGSGGWTGISAVTTSGGTATLRILALLP